MRKFSRLLTVEERKNRKRAFFYIFASIILFLILIFLGIPSFAKLGAFISGLRGGQFLEEVEKIPPAKPVFLTAEGATNSAKIKISGTSEPKAEILIFHNGKELEKMITDEGGTFEKEVRLFDGENSFVARAKDQSGNESQNSPPLIITLDTNAPMITITEPEITLFQEENVTLRGKINEEAQVSINNRAVLTDSENNFSAPVKLNSGENKFLIRAVDNAGNTSEKELTFVLSL